MDIKVSSVNFSGRKEVIYGLTKAVKEIHSYSVGMSPRLQQYGENRNLAKHEAAAKAYLDMITHDEEFAGCLSLLPNMLLKNIFKKYLEPIEGGSEIKPLNYLNKFMNDVMDENRMFNHTKREAGRGIIKRLSEL